MTRFVVIIMGWKVRDRREMSWMGLVSSTLSRGWYMGPSLTKMVQRDMRKSMPRDTVGLLQCVLAHYSPHVPRQNGTFDRMAEIFSSLQIKYGHRVTTACHSAHASYDIGSSCRFPSQLIVFGLSRRPFPTAVVSNCFPPGT